MIQQEEQVYSLLFQECDRERVGSVDIDELVKYIGHMRQQAPPQQEGEEVIVSEDPDSVKTVESGGKCDLMQFFFFFRGTMI